MEFNPEEERAKVSKEQHNASLTLSHLADAALMSEQQPQEEGLQCLPSFPLAGEYHYILLQDIMHSLNIRQDYCLALQLLVFAARQTKGLWRMK